MFFDAKSNAESPETLPWITEDLLAKTNTPHSKGLAHARAFQLLSTGLSVLRALLYCPKSLNSPARDSWIICRFQQDALVVLRQFLLRNRVMYWRVWRFATKSSRNRRTWTTPSTPRLHSPLTFMGSGRGIFVYLFWRKLPPNETLVRLGSFRRP
jgi:hypothetical protein